MGIKKNPELTDFSIISDNISRVSLVHTPLFTPKTCALGLTVSIKKSRISHAACHQSKLQFLLYNSLLHANINILSVRMPVNINVINHSIILDIFLSQIPTLEHSIDKESQIKISLFTWTLLKAVAIRLWMYRDIASATTITLNNYPPIPAQKSGFFKNVNALHVGNGKALHL